MTPEEGNLNQTQSDSLEQKRRRDILSMLLEALDGTAKTKKDALLAKQGEARITRFLEAIKEIDLGRLLNNRPEDVLPPEIKVAFKAQGAGCCPTEYLLVGSSQNGQHASPSKAFVVRVLRNLGSIKEDETLRHLELPPTRIETDRELRIAHGVPTDVPGINLRVNLTKPNIAILVDPQQFSQS